MAKFMVFYEGKPLNTYIIDEPVITIGRLPENTISIANMGVSRRHLRIEEDYDRRLVLTDLNSLNGTSVNGKRVKKVPLNSGDKITIGKFTIVFEEMAPGTEVSPDGGAGGPVSATEVPREPEQSEKRSDTRSFLMPKEREALASEETPVPRDPERQPSVQEEKAEADEKVPVLIETAKHLSYMLDKPYMTIGSGESDDILISGFLVKEQQAVIEQTGEGWQISTKKLMGKLKVNGRQIKSHLLRHKDRIDIGPASFRFMENS